MPQMLYVDPYRRQQASQSQFLNILSSLALQKVAQNFRSQEAQAQRDLQMGLAGFSKQAPTDKTTKTPSGGRRRVPKEAVQPDVVAGEQEYFYTGAPGPTPKVKPIVHGGKTVGYTYGGRFYQAPKPKNPTAIVQEYMLWKLENPTGNMRDFYKQSGRTRPSTNVSVSVGDRGMTKLAEEMGTSIVDKFGEVEQTALNLKQLMSVKKLLDKSMITGFGAEYRLGFGRALQQAGFNFADDAIANTETYAAVMGSQVGTIIKQFGAGTGLSDADREYAEKIVGGKITLNRKSLKKITSILEKGYRNAIKSHNKKVRQLMRMEGTDQLPYSLYVEMPSGIDYSSMTDDEILKALGQ